MSKSPRSRGGSLSATALHGKVVSIVQSARSPSARTILQKFHPGPLLSVMRDLLSLRSRYAHLHVVCPVAKKGEIS